MAMEQFKSQTSEDFSAQVLLPRQYSSFENHNNSCYINHNNNEHYDKYNFFPQNDINYWCNYYHSENQGCFNNFLSNHPQRLLQSPQQQQQSPQQQYYINYRRSDMESYYSNDNFLSHNRRENCVGYYHIENNCHFDHTTPSFMTSRSHGHFGHKISQINQGFSAPTLAYYIPPDFGQYNNMINSSSKSLPQPPPPYQPKYRPTKELLWRIVNQINYYFSDENLKDDAYLKNRMDADGWVPITLIANFRQVSKLTDDIGFILYALRNSSIVEVSGPKIRRKR